MAKGNLVESGSACGVGRAPPHSPPPLPYRVLRRISSPQLMSPAGPPAAGFKPSTPSPAAAGFKPSAPSPPAAGSKPRAPSCHQNGSAAPSASSRPGSSADAAKGGNSELAALEQRLKSLEKMLSPSDVQAQHVLASHRTRPMLHCLQPPAPIAPDLNAPRPLPHSRFRLRLALPLPARLPRRAPPAARDRCRPSAFR